MIEITVAHGRAATESVTNEASTRVQGHAATGVDVASGPVRAHTGRDPSKNEAGAEDGDDANGTASN